MKQIKIIGVPEHFNYPWHLAMKEGAFKERGIDLEWEDIPEGTGRMCQMLKEQETDLAIILTEGIIKSISEGNPAKIVQEYIASPLLWGIHVGAQSNFEKIEDLMGEKCAISRLGSGSHLMAYVFAENQGWNTDLLDFEIINNLDGGVESLTKGEVAFFMWEHFTTKPLVDRGVFRRLGDCPTPWPCFVIAASDTFLQKEPTLLSHILEVINSYTIEFKSIPSIDRTLANKYLIELDDINNWLSKTSWSQKQIDTSIAKDTYGHLLKLGLAKDGLDIGNILYHATHKS